MIDAAVQRLHDLVETAGELESVLTQPDAEKQLHGMQVARLTVDLDKAAARLAQHVDKLAKGTAIKAK